MSSSGAFLGAPSAVSYSSSSTDTTATTTPTSTAPTSTDRQCEPSMTTPAPRHPFIRLVFKKHVSPPPSPLVATPDSIDDSPPRRRRRRREDSSDDDTAGKAIAPAPDSARCSTEQQQEVGRTVRKRRKSDEDGIIPDTAESFSTTPATTVTPAAGISPMASRGLRRKRSRLTVDDEVDVAGARPDETSLVRPPPPPDHTSGSRSGSASPQHSATTSYAASCAKRKRTIPECIGGGKGELQPTPELLRIPDTPPPPEAAERVREKRSRVIVGGEKEKIGGSREPGANEDTGKTEDKRILRSQAPPSKRSEFEEWFELQDEPDFDYDAPIPVVWLKDDDKPTLKETASAAPTIPNPPSPPPTSIPAPEPSNSASKPPENPNKPPPEEFPTFDWEAELAKHGCNPSKFKSDPLQDSLYTAAHIGDVRRESRQRNIERERLAFAAQNYEQTLTALRNPGWQKAINLSAATASQFTPEELENRRKKLEEYMSNFIAKQKRFTDAERKPKGGAVRRSFSPHGHRDHLGVHSADEEAGGGDGARRNKTRKLSVEAPSSARKTLKQQDHHRDHHHEPQEPEFTSFYANQQLRDQALRTGRRKSDRILTAFGQPLSTDIFQEREFVFPEYLLEGKELRSRHVV